MHQSLRDSWTGLRTDGSDENSGVEDDTVD